MCEDGNCYGRVTSDDLCDDLSALLLRIQNNGFTKMARLMDPPAMLAYAKWVWGPGWSAAGWVGRAARGRRGRSRGRARATGCVGAWEWRRARLCVHGAHGAPLLTAGLRHVLPPTTAAAAAACCRCLNNTALWRHALPTRRAALLKVTVLQQMVLMGGPKCQSKNSDLVDAAQDAADFLQARARHAGWSQRFGGR